MLNWVNYSENDQRLQPAVATHWPIKRPTAAVPGISRTKGLVLSVLRLTMCYAREANSLFKYPIPSPHVLFKPYYQLDCIRITKEHIFVPGFEGVSERFKKGGKTPWM